MEVAMHEPPVNRIFAVLREIMITNSGDRFQHAMVANSINFPGRWICKQ
jgi:hypothetical protein